MPVWTNVETVIKAVGRTKANVKVKVADRLNKCGDIILTRARYLCPKETRALERSGRKVTTGVGLGTRVKITFGDHVAHYALWVHENLLAYHEPPTTAKFLTKAIFQTRGACAAVLRGYDMRAGVSKFIGGNQIRHY